LQIAGGVFALCSGSCGSIHRTHLLPSLHEKEKRGMQIMCSVFIIIDANVVI
jgi:hypothetical protein